MLLLGLQPLERVLYMRFLERRSSSGLCPRSRTQDSGSRVGVPHTTRGQRKGRPVRAAPRVRLPGSRLAVACILRRQPAALDVVRPLLAGTTGARLYARQKRRQ